MQVLEEEVPQPIPPVLGVTLQGGGNTGGCLARGGKAMAELR